MKHLVSAALVTAVAAGTAEFVFLPEGKHQIRPQTQKKGITINVPVERGEAIAAALQADLDERLKQNVEPWFDFEHTRKYPKSGYPKSFRYEKGKGVMCSVEWSRSGRNALRGRDVNHFSPEFYVGDDGVPNGLPERGPLGGLVSEPAFRDLPAIAASADIDPDPNESQAMSKFLILASIGLLTENEAASDGAEDLARKRVTAMRTAGADLDTLRTEHNTLKTEHGELKTKVTAAETAAKEAATKRAGDLVTAAITDGRIAPADEETAKGFRERIAAGDAFAEKMLAERPKLNGNLGQTVIKGGNGDRQVVAAAGEHAFETKARALVTAGQAADMDEALSVVAASDPALYGAYLSTLQPAG